MRQTIAIVAAIVWVIAPAPVDDPAASVERAAINDNRTPAGTLRGGVLALDLEVREVDWRPDRDDQPGLVVRAFAERGKRPSIPGPLIRVPEGTTMANSCNNMANLPTINVPARPARARKSR